MNELEQAEVLSRIIKNLHDAQKPFAAQDHWWKQSTPELHQAEDLLGKLLVKVAEGVTSNGT